MERTMAKKNEKVRGDIYNEIIDLQVCTHMHTCTHAHMHTCIHAHMHTSTHAYMHILYVTKQI